MTGKNSSPSLFLATGKPVNDSPCFTTSKKYGPKKGVHPGHSILGRQYRLQTLTSQVSSGNPPKHKGKRQAVLCAYRTSLNSPSNNVTYGFVREPEPPAIVLATHHAPGVEGPTRP